LNYFSLCLCVFVAKLINMQKFEIPIQVRWSDIDQNRHLRHSAYYDYGATTRIACFSQHGLTNLKFEELRIGPILFREEAIFKREIKFEDLVTVDLVVVKSTKDFSRWSIRHHIYKEDRTIAAVLNMDGAWIDMTKRKLATPNEFIQKVFEDFPRAEEFVWVEKTIPSTSQ
jgi:acyl-CoA thioester hydrolase